MRPSQWSRRRRMRSPLGTLAVLAAIAVIAGFAALFQPAPETLVGHATAVDGDTLRMGLTRIRLTGFDAVELDQRCINIKGGDWKCGYSARDFVARLIRDGETRCVAEGKDRYGRVLAKCRTETGDLGDAIVRAGWAVADLEYAAALADARFNQRGAWIGTFDDPAQWRRSHGGDGFDLWAWLMSLVPR